MNTLHTGDRVKYLEGWTGTIELITEHDDFFNNEPSASVRADDNGSSYTLPLNEFTLIK